MTGSRGAGRPRRCFGCGEGPGKSSPAWPGWEWPSRAAVSRAAWFRRSWVGKATRGARPTMGTLGSSLLAVAGWGWVCTMSIGLATPWAFELRTAACARRSGIRRPGRPLNGGCRASPSRVGRFGPRRVFRGGSHCDGARGMPVLYTGHGKWRGTGEVPRCFPWLDRLGGTARTCRAEKAFAGLLQPDDKREVVAGFETQPAERFLWVVRETATPQDGCENLAGPG